MTRNVPGVGSRPIQSAMPFPHSYSRRRSTLHRRVNAQAIYRNIGCPGETDLFFWSKFKVTIVYYFMNILHKRSTCRLPE